MGTPFRDTLSHPSGLSAAKVACGKQLCCLQPPTPRCLDLPQAQSNETKLTVNQTSETMGLNKSLFLLTIVFSVFITVYETLHVLGTHCYDRHI